MSGSTVYLRCLDAKIVSLWREIELQQMTIAKLNLGGHETTEATAACKRRLECLEAMLQATDGALLHRIGWEMEIPVHGSEEVNYGANH